MNGLGGRFLSNQFPSWEDFDLLRLSNGPAPIVVCSKVTSQDLLFKEGTS